MDWLIIGISAVVLLATAATVAGVAYVLRHDDERKWAK
jgi:hypothetical protein